MDYDSAYRQIHRGSAGVIPSKAFAAAGAVPLRALATEAVPAEPAQGIPRAVPTQVTLPVRPPTTEPEPSRIERTREVTDLLWRKSNYKTVNCNCGTKLKLPAKLGISQVKCPHCGRTNYV